MPSKLILLILLFASACTEPLPEPDDRVNAGALTPQPLSVNPGQVKPHAEPAARLDTTFEIAGQSYQLSLAQTVASESTFVRHISHYDGGEVDTMRYFDNEVRAIFSRDDQLLLDQTFLKGDFIAAKRETKPDYWAQFESQATLWRFDPMTLTLLPDSVAVSVILTVMDTDWLEEFVLEFGEEGSHRIHHVDQLAHE
ncbi:MAG: hypothetical protein AAF624_12660 [Bacteroidota bacterium]